MQPHAQIPMTSVQLVTFWISISITVPAQQASMCPAVGQTFQCHIGHIIGNVGHDEVLEWCSRPQMMMAHMQCSMLATGDTRQQNHPRPPGPRPYQSEDQLPGSHSPGESASHHVHQAVIIFLGTGHRLILHEMSCLPPPMHSV